MPACFDAMQLCKYVPGSPHALVPSTAEMGDSAYGNFISKRFVIAMTVKTFIR